MTKFQLIISALIIVIASAIMPNRVSAAKISTCNDLEFIFARGSGEELDGPSFTAWRAALTDIMQESGLGYNFYELGSSEQNGVQYPAVAVSGSADGYGNLLGAYISGGESFKFGQSVIAGSSELKARIENVSRACPQTKFVLGGYSQGAMLISRVLSQLPSEKIIYVATFGDPKIYLPEGKGVPSAACLGRQYSEYRVYVPDCQAYEGVLGSYRPYQPTGYSGKLGTWCNEKDIMCSSGMSINDHTSYASGGLYQAAAQVIHAKLAAAFPDRFQNSDQVIATTKHNLAIIIDSTGSMGGMIGSYKKEALRLASKVFASDGQVALYEYRDLADPFETVKLCDFGCTLDELSEKLDQIETDGGGDDPESALSAIMTAMNTLSWQPGATKSIVLLTDNDYLRPDRDGMTLTEVVQRSLEIDPVNLYVITKDTMMECYTELAAATGGQVFDVKTGLKLSTDTIIGRPVAALPQSSYQALVGQTINFDASQSLELSGLDLAFDWDLDGDGNFEFSDYGAIIQHAYSSAQDRYIQVRVRDQRDNSSTMSAHLIVQSEFAQPSTISALSSNMLDSTTAEIDFATDAKYLLIALDDAVLGFVDPAQGRFVLRDLQQGSKLTLIPYNTAHERGEARTITISSEKSPAAPEAKVPSASSSSQKTSPQIKKPTVPNTGYFELRCQ